MIATHHYGRKPGETLCGLLVNLRYHALTERAEGVDCAACRRVLLREGLLPGLSPQPCETCGDVARPCRCLRRTRAIALVLVAALAIALVLFYAAWFRAVEVVRP